MNIYYGDIHTHCGISYGFGPLADALANARLQLDFCSVTGHALWPDMPRERADMKRTVEYHQTGFDKLAAGWDDVLRQIAAAHQDGRFVTFLTYEMHSCASGDHTVAYRDGVGTILPSGDLPQLQQSVRNSCARGVPMMVIPHHIAYPRGYRGINWDHFDPAVSPVVEMMSMHGCSESDDAPYPFLHTMGPRDHDSTIAAGLARGFVFGLVACTDHHSAHPGSHGHGRFSVFAPRLTRADLWQAIEQRRTVALTGDRIAVQFTLNDAPMGSVLDARADKRRLAVSVCAGGAIERVELLRNEQVIARRMAAVRPAAPAGVVRAKVALEVGWGRRAQTHPWDVRLSLSEGRLLAIEPRFKGADIVSPEAGANPDAFAFSRWQPDGESAVCFRTRTQGNPTTVTNANQSMGVEVEMPVSAKLIAQINGREFSWTLAEVLAGARAGYVDGYGTPAWRITAALPAEYEWTFTYDDLAGDAPWAAGRDVYRVRVAQKNNQWAWTSPIWVRA